MNCKKGDLAIVVNGENTGTLVDVIEEHPLYGTGTWLVIAHGSGTAIFGTFKPGDWVGCDDSKLRPIRDQPGEDETLTWAPVAQKETV